MSTELIWTAFADEMEKQAKYGKLLALGAGGLAGAAGLSALGAGVMGGEDFTDKSKAALRIARGAPRTPDVGSIPRAKDIITEPRAVTPEGVQTPWPEWMTR